MQGGITYCFGDFEVQADEQRVLLRGLPIPLGARAFGLLLALLLGGSVLGGAVFGVDGFDTVDAEGE